MQKREQKSYALYAISLVILVIGALVVNCLIYRIRRAFAGVIPRSQNVPITDVSPPNRYTAKNYSFPNSVVKTLYLEITNIAQGINIAIFVYIVTTGNFFSSLVMNYFSTPLIALTSLLIAVVFWARYYLDTEILDRSFTTLSLTWFFIFVIIQGISISLMTNPFAWLVSTGIFLLFGAGFYLINLGEIRRKQQAGAMPEWPAFVIWQKKRMIELIILSILTLSGAVLLQRNPVIAFSESIIALAVAIWQLAITRDYRKLGFIETGI